MNNTTKKVLLASCAAAGAAAAATAASFVTADLLSRIALDREAPKFLGKVNRLISGSRKQSSLRDQKQEAALRLEKTENELVRITSRDGVALTGHWIAQKDPKRVIIAMHGWRSSWSWDFGVPSEFWAQSGCSVLYAEQRGQGESGGDYMGFGLTERYDCLDWIQWVTGRCGGSVPVYLAGVSMGATTVLMAGGLTLPENVRGILADCGFTSPHAIWKHVARDNLHLAFGLHGAMADAIYHKKNPLASAEESTVDALRGCSVPVLFIHGTDDTFVPVEMTYENYKACASPKKLLIVPGAGHAMSYCVDPESYRAATAEFWKRFDS